MRIQTASSITQPQTQRKIGEALAQGATVTIPLPAKQEVPSLLEYLGSPELQQAAAAYVKIHAAQPVLAIHPSLQKNLLNLEQNWTKEQKLAFGVAGGAITGAGVGLLVSTVSAVAPRTGAALMLACALVGSGLSMGVASGALAKAKMKVNPATGEVELEIEGGSQAA